MRKVVIKTAAQKDPIEHESSAATFGQLKKELKQIKWSGMRVVERASKMSLQMDDSVLPQGDFVLFLVPEKVKSGRKTSGGLDKIDVATANYNQLRSHMSWLNREKGCSLNLAGGTEDLRRRLKDYYRRQKGKKPATTKPVAKKSVAKKATPKPTPKPEPKKEKKEKKEKKKKKGLFSKKTPVDPIQAIEDNRQLMNKAIDEIVLSAIEAGPAAGVVLKYTNADLEKEIKEVHKALRTSRSSAKYID